MLSERQLKSSFLSRHIPILLTEAARRQLDFPTGLVGGLSNSNLALVTTNKAKMLGNYEFYWTFLCVFVCGIHTLRSEVYHLGFNLLKYS